MKLIKEIILHNKAVLQINHISGVMRIWIDSRNSISLNDSGIKSYREYSKSELIKIQYILLNSYVFSYDLLDDLIKNSESKKTLNDKKELVQVIRKELRDITSYIDSYEEMLTEFKDV